MASAKNLENKKQTVDEIANKIKSSESVIIFSYQGMSVEDMANLRKELRKSDSEFKIYKNTLAKRAFEDTGLNDEAIWTGPNAILFGKELLDPIKVISKFSKDNEHITIRTGMANGNVLTLEEIQAYADIPSRDGLLAQISMGLMQYVQEVAIGLDMYANKLEENN